MLNGLYIDSYGDKRWYKEDKLHREDGPAVEGSNGSRSWYKNGNLHREDGPAVDYSNGYKAWYLNDVRYFEEEYNKKLSTCEGKVVEIDGKKYKLISM